MLEKVDLNKSVDKEKLQEASGRDGCEAGKNCSAPVKEEKDPGCHRILTASGQAVRERRSTA